MKLYCRSFVAALLAAGGLLTAPAAMAQKIVDKTLWTAYHKAPAVALAPQYKSYTLAYDLGNTVTTVENPPVLRPLQVQKSGGDLLLTITAQAPLIKEQTLVTSSASVNGKAETRYCYDVLYTAKRGYQLVDAHSSKTLASYEESEGSVRTKEFTSKKPLDAYMRTELMPALAKEMLEGVLKRTEYELADNTWQARFTVNSVAGAAPAHQQITAASEAYIATLATAQPDQQKIKDAIAVWEAQLAQVQWEDKKAELNKKVGLALIENLCSAYLLQENYAAIKEKTTIFDAHNVENIFGKIPPRFHVERTYTGPVSAAEPVKRDGSIYMAYYVYFRSGIGNRAVVTN